MFHVEKKSKIPIRPVNEKKMESDELAIGHHCVCRPVASVKMVLLIELILSLLL